MPGPGSFKSVAVIPMPSGSILYHTSPVWADMTGFEVAVFKPMQLKWKLQQLNLSNLCVCFVLLLFKP
jgi:hypothetical protein